MTQSSDRPNSFCADWTRAARIDLHDHLNTCLDSLPDSVIAETEVSFSPHRSVTFAHDRPAAVLVSFLKVQNEWHILMTKRAAHLAHHAGQISFPGGKLEATDSGPVTAALREAFEEVSLAPDWVAVIGALDAVRSPAGFLVQPAVGIITGKNRLQDLARDPMEVELIFTLPIMHLANPKNLRLVVREIDGRSSDYWVIEHHEHFIWGLSARVLVDLFQRFGVLNEVQI